MANWGEFSAEAADLAREVADRLQGHPHHILGTIGVDGSPRLHGITLGLGHGELWFGCMPNSVKENEIRRDHRVAIHSAPLDPDLASGDCRILGRALPLDDRTVEQWSLSDEVGSFFRVDIAHVHLVEVVGEQLRLTSWKTGRGIRIVERR